MVVKMCDYTNVHWIVHFKGVNFKDVNWISKIAKLFKKNCYGLKPWTLKPICFRNSPYLFSAGSKMNRSSHRKTVSLSR